jgi:hypothetical protein
MSWGYRITILTLGFVGFMTFLVISAFRQNFDLVTEDYYGKELQFQTQIEKQKNYQQLKESIQCILNEADLMIKFPADFSNKKMEGEITLFRPSDASKDLKVKIASLNGVQIIDRKQLIPGLYRIQIDYESEGKAYYFEEDIMIY